MYLRQNNRFGEKMNVQPDVQIIGLFLGIYIYTKKITTGVVAELRKGSVFDDLGLTLSAPHFRLGNKTLEVE